MIEEASLILLAFFGASILISVDYLVITRNYNK